jgi:putative FmdB family regulatory protein
MPIYEYECTKCGHYLEALQKIADKPLRECPECGKHSLKRLVSAPMFRLSAAAGTRRISSRTRRTSVISSTRATRTRRRRRRQARDGCQERRQVRGFEAEAKSEAKPAGESKPERTRTDDHETDREARRACSRPQGSRSQDGRSTRQTLSASESGRGYTVTARQ